MMLTQLRGKAVLPSTLDPWGLLTRAWLCRFGLSWLWRAAMQSLAARQESLYRLYHKAGLHQVRSRAL